MSKQLVKPVEPITIGLEQHQEGLLGRQLVLVAVRFCDKKGHIAQGAERKDQHEEGWKGGAKGGLLVREG